MSTLAKTSLKASDLKGLFVAIRCASQSEQGSAALVLLDHGFSYSLHHSPGMFKMSRDIFIMSDGTFLNASNDSAEVELEMTAADFLASNPVHVCRF